MRTLARARGPAPAPVGCAVSSSLTPCPQCVWNKDFLLLVPDGPWVAPRGRCGGEWRRTGAWDALQTTLHGEAVSQPEAAPVLVSKLREQQTPRLEPETGCAWLGPSPGLFQLLVASDGPFCVFTLCSLCVSKCPFL